MDILLAEATEEECKLACFEHYESMIGEAADDLFGVDPKCYHKDLVDSDSGLICGDCGEIITLRMEDYR